MKKQMSILTATLLALSTSQAQKGFPAPPDMNRFANPSAGAAPKAGLDNQQKDKFNRAGMEDITNENFPDTIESFDFPNVEITDIIKAISELTGKNFIIDPGVRGKITIIAPSKLTVAEAYKAFLSALAINGFTVVPSGSFLKVKSSRNAQRDSIETYSGSYYPNSDQMITRIIHLKHISAEQVNRDLRILPSKDGEMSVYTPTNSIILSDYGSNIDRVMKIISQLDIPGFEDQLEVIPIKFAKAKDLADLVDKIINKGEKKSTGPAGAFTAGVPRFSRAGSASSQQGSSYFMAIPDDRTNAIIAVGSKSGIARVKKLLTQLDFRIRPEDTGGVNVYYVKNGDAEKIAAVLTGVAKDTAPKPGTPGGMFTPPSFGGLGANNQQQAANSGEIFGGDVKITADKTTNSLVVVASKQDYEVVLNLLAKLDIPRDQVFVEAIIMEMSMNDGNNWGVGYYRYNDSGYGKAGFNGGIDLNSMLSPTGGQGAIIGFGSGQTVTVTDPSTKTQLTIPNLIGFINFLKSNKRANILSTPQIMALDNQEAEIEVGDKVATGVNVNTTASGQTTSPIFEDATIKLNIKPFISPSSETIRMEIKQTVKQLTSGVNLPKALQDNSQPLASRAIKTSIVVNNGDTAILGGLIKDAERENVSKVPLLGDLPIIGWLFKSREMLKDKVNMVVFLTPKIIRNPNDQKQIIGKKLDQRLDYIKSQGGKDPFGSTVDEIEKKLGRGGSDSQKKTE